MTNFDVFISYHRESTREEAIQLAINLEKLNYKVWLEENNKVKDSEINTAIQNCKVFICCITKKYCQSKNCNLEIEYANQLKDKPLIALMVDDLTLSEIDTIYESKIGLILR